MQTLCSEKKTRLAIYPPPLLTTHGLRFTSQGVGRNVPESVQLYGQMPSRMTERDPNPPGTSNNNKLVLILTRHTLARAGLANRLLDRHEVVTDNGDVDTLGQATP